MQILFLTSSTLSLMSASVLEAACHTTETVAESANGDEELTASGSSSVGGAAGVSASQTVGETTEPFLTVPSSDLCTAESDAAEIGAELDTVLTTQQQSVGGGFSSGAGARELFDKPPPVTSNAHAPPPELPLPATDATAADASGSTCSAAFPPPSSCPDPVQKQSTADVAISPTSLDAAYPDSAPPDPASIVDDCGKEQPLTKPDHQHIQGEIAEDSEASLSYSYCDFPSVMVRNVEIFAHIIILHMHFTSHN